MTLAVPPQHIEALLALAARRDMEATVLGIFTDTGLFHVLYGGKTVALLDMDFLYRIAGDASVGTLATPTPSRAHLPCPTDLTASLLRMLERLNICNKECHPSIRIMKYRA